MEQQIEKFDPSKLMDGVKDRIKSTFVSLIPDDMWNSMVEKEIYIFTTGRIIPHHEYQGTGEDCKPIYKDWEERIPYSDVDEYNKYGNLTKKGECSPLSQMIRDELRKKFAEDLKKFLEGEEYQAAFDEFGAPEISKALEEILVKNADTIFHKFMATMMQSAFLSMKSRIASAVMSGNFNDL